MIDKQVQQLLDEVRAEMIRLKHPPLEQTTPSQARYYNGKARRFFSDSKFKNIDIENLHMEDINCRIYAPKSKEPLPILVYFHGGGWVFGDLNGNDFVCSYISKYSNCVVVAVDYRKSPEFKYPIPLEDAYFSVQWIHDNIKKLNGNGRLAVGGESAGANLAASVNLKLRDMSKLQVYCQLLITPVTQYSFETESYNAGFQYNLTKEKMKWFWKHYLQNDLQGKEPYASPLFGSAEKLPKALIYTAELDPLKDDGLLYAKHLENRNVYVQYKCFKTLVHSFIHMAGRASRANEAFMEICNDFSSIIHSYSKLN